LRGCKRQVAIIDWLQRTAFVFLDVVAADDPLPSQLREAFAHVGADGRIAVGARRLVDAHGGILFQLVFEIARRVLIDLAERDADAGLLAIDVDAA
jgi:hypothetical protein